MASYDDNKNPSQLDALTDATIANGDYAVVGDVSDSGHAKGITWAHIKAALKAYFDTLYHVVGGTDVPVADGGTGASDAGTARTNLGLGSSAVRDVGTTAGTVAAGDHDHSGVYEPADGTILKDADIGVSVAAQGHDHSGVYQPLDNELTALAGVTAAANKIPIFSGINTANTIDLKDEDNMASDSATAVPTQQSVKAYVDAHSGTPDHGALTGLSDDDHTQYSKADGTRDFSGIVGYDTHKTFSSDTDIVDKKYVDDSIVAAGGYTDEQAQDAVGGMLVDTATIDFTYTDATPEITAAVKAASLDTTHITAAALVTEADTIAANDNDTTIPTSAAVKAYADAVTPEGTAIKSTGEVGGVKFLREDGDGTCSWQTVPAGSGDVSKVGTPVDNQIGVWTGDGTIEGDANLTFDGAGNLQVESDSAGIVGATLTLKHNSATPADNDDVGVIYFDGKDDGGNNHTFASIYGYANDVSDTTEGGGLYLSVADGTGGTARVIDAYAYATGANIYIGNDADFGGTFFIDDTQTGGFLNATGTGMVFDQSASPKLQLKSSDGIVGVGLSTQPAVLKSIGDQDLTLQTGNATTGNITITDGAAGQITIAPATTGVTQLYNADAGATGAVLELYHDSASPAANDSIGKILFYGEDSASNKQQYGAIETSIDDTTSGSEDATLALSVVKAGTTGLGRSALLLKATAFSPESNDTIALGTTTAQFSDLFLAEGGVINWDNGDVTLTQTGNQLEVAGGDLKIGTLTGVLRADTGVVSADTDVTDIVSAASDTTAGKVELATSAETTTGTDATRAVTPDGLAGSDYGKREVQLTVVDYTTDVATGDGKSYFRVPSSLNGYNLVGVYARVITAGTTGTMDIQIRNVTDAQDMLSTKITIDSTETDSSSAATAAVINASYDDVATGDLLAVDVDAVQTTKAKGLIVGLTFQLP